jgi:Mn2+/Fe2+ NRAMP family transporter
MNEQQKEFNEIRTQMGKEFKDRQDKFAYYLMGLNVAAIGFAISKTFDIQPEQSLIFVALALLCWLLSICLAFYWIFTQQNAVMLQSEVMNIILGLNDKISPTIENIRLAKQEFDKEASKKSNKAGKAYAYMLYLFMSGIIFFVLWRLFELFNWKIWQ